MISTEKRLRIAAVLILTALGLGLASGCGDDDPVAIPTPEDPARITIQLTATVASITDLTDVLGSSIQVGDAITGFYIYDSTIVDSNAHAAVGDYRHTSAPYGIFLTINNTPFGTDPDNVNFLIELINDNAIPIRDNHLLRSYNNLSATSAIAVDHIAWQLDDYGADALASTDLTTEPPLLADWTSVRGIEITGHDNATPDREYIITSNVTAATKTK